MRENCKILLFIFCLSLLAPVTASAHRRKTDDVKTNKLLGSLEKADFSISAKIYYGDKDETEIPVKTEFYLLDKNLIDGLFGSKLIAPFTFSDI